MNHVLSPLIPLLCVIGFVGLGSAGLWADDKAALEKEVSLFQGTWTIESSITGGVEIPTDQLKGLVMVFESDKHTVKMGDQVIQVGTQKLDPSKSPKTIDVTMTEGPSKGMVMLGIYELDGDTLKVCFDATGKKRPTEFKSEPGSTTFVNVHKRVKR
ncbi:MAG TPA: TIGR03067 domain-containing protein [Gemmatales bacterium]|nr:TIGR03067 domain-containing protein [Gemmatales bacterium]HMP60170.1 TIGR03067 domain-containing protein [Gemmatales bacterium]